MADETILRSHGLRTNVGKLIRVDTLEGREHLVAPVVLITEGVHNNVYYSADELSKHTDAWNGRPLVAPSHPTVNGRPVTANSKKVLEKMQVGTVLNVHWNVGTKKLLGEAWFDKEKTQAKCPKVLAELEKDAPQVEVSTGLYTDDTFKANVFNSKQYACEAKNHRPDHLAVLLNAKGACSWEDGAGLPRINSAADDDEVDEPLVNWDEGEHPRGEAGKFVAAGGSIEHATELHKEWKTAYATIPKHLPNAVAHYEKMRDIAEQAELGKHETKDPAARAQYAKTQRYAENEMKAINRDWQGQPRIRANAYEGGHIVDEDGDGMCPDCGGELVDGVCPECDGEEDPVAPKQNAIMRTLSAIAEKLGITVNKKDGGVSLREKEQRVSKALQVRYNQSPIGNNWAAPSPVTPSPWVRDLFDGYVVYDLLGKTYKLDVSWNGGVPELGGEPVEVVQNTEWLPKNNSADQWIETEDRWDVPGWEAAK